MTPSTLIVKPRKKKVLTFPAAATAGARSVSNRDQFRLAWASALAAAEAMFEAERTNDFLAYLEGSASFDKAMHAALHLMPRPTPQVGVRDRPRGRSRNSKEQH